MVVICKSDVVNNLFTKTKKNTNTTKMKTKTYKHYQEENKKIKKKTYIIYKKMRKKNLLNVHTSMYTYIQNVYSIYASKQKIKIIDVLFLTKSIYKYI